ncbi:MAG: hypothetical protein IIC30_04040 [Chloroflexi bacterium]|nr:hypothetical protein [Chloroflexota bacterium]
MSTDIIIAVEVLVSVYIVGAIVSMKTGDLTAGLSESQGQAARTRAGVYWPRRLALWLAARALPASRA